MSDFEDDIGEQLLELAGATERKKKKRQGSGGTGASGGSGGVKKRKAEYVIFLFVFYFASFVSGWHWHLGSLCPSQSQFYIP